MSGWGEAAAEFELAEESQVDPSLIPEPTRSLRLVPRKPKGRPRKTRSFLLGDVEGSDCEIVSDITSQDLPSGSGIVGNACTDLVVARHPSCFQGDFASVAKITQTDLAALAWKSELSQLQKELFARIPVKAMSRGKDHDQEGSKSTMGAFLHDIFQSSRPLASQKVQQKVLGGRIDGYYATTSSAIFELGICEWSGRLSRCMELIDAGRMKGILLVKQRLYDETPLRLRHSDEEGQTGITKVLQSQFRIGMLLQDSASGKLVFLHGFVPVILQALEVKKAEDIMCAQMKVEQSVVNLQRCAERFRLSVQLVTTDRDGTNMKAERGMQHANPQDARIHLPCDVHKVSTCLTAMLNLVPGDVTGLVNFGLLLRPAGSVGKFRDCIMQEIAARFQVIIGMPPMGHAQTYRTDVYKMFLGSSHSNSDVHKKNQQVRLAQVEILSFFLNGDLQDEQNVVWYSPFDVSKDAALKLVSQHVPHALLPVGIHIFPRHRWHGCEIPIDQLALLAAHHNLLKHATFRFLNAGGAPKPSQVQETTGWAGAALCFSLEDSQQQPEDSNPGAELEPISLLETGQAQDSAQPQPST